MNAKNLLIGILLMSGTTYAQVAVNYKLPENGIIKQATLSGSASCKEAGDYKPLNLISNSKDLGYDVPELVLNYPCGKPPLIMGSMFTLIADIGDVPLDEMNYGASLTPELRIGMSHNFRTSAVVKENTTYSVILNTYAYSGVLVFRVLSFKDNVLTIEYATRSYLLMKIQDYSPIIDKNLKNYRR